MATKGNRMTINEYREYLMNESYSTHLEPTAPGSPPKQVYRLRAKIGDSGLFFRSGKLPPRGKSYDYRGGKYLCGVSVYPTPFPTSLAGLSGDQWYFGKGTIVGIGSDGEPLITPTGTWKKIGKPGYSPIITLYDKYLRGKKEKKGGDMATKGKGKGKGSGRAK